MSFKNNCTDPDVVTAVLEHVGDSAVGLRAVQSLSFEETWSTGKVALTSLDKGKPLSKAVGGADGAVGGGGDGALGVGGDGAVGGGADGANGGPLSPLVLSL